MTKQSISQIAQIKVVRRCELNLGDTFLSNGICCTLIGWESLNPNNPRWGLYRVLSHNKDRCFWIRPTDKVTIITF